MKQANIKLGFAALTSLILIPSMLTAGAQPTAKQLIKEFDADRDGSLNGAELEAALKSLFPESPKFVRVSKNDKGVPESLETAISSFKSKDDKLRVDLIGAVHVADKSYYTTLNDRFKEYDVVLYELVAPEGARVPRRGQRSQHPVGRMQQGLKSLLDLSFQLNHIDYTADNLVHADMSPEEFAKSMKDRGESFIQILFRMMGQAASKAGKTNAPTDADLIFALFSNDRAMKLKRIMATQFEDIEGQMQILQGPDGSTLITERNKKALEVLRQELKDGHNRIGIFYGAGHLPDFAERLESDFELQHADTQWLQAWDMSD